MKILIYGKKIKKLSSNSKFTSCSIDGKSCHSNMASLFAGKFSQLYSSVGYTQSELDNDVKSTNGDKCENNLSIIHVRGLLVSDVENGVKQLKKGKRDGNFSLGTDNLTNGTLTLSTLLSCCLLLCWYMDTALIVCYLVGWFH